LNSAAHFRVSGRVQGVFFRQSTRQEARRLGLGGWVCNMPDGSVEGEACGNAGALSELRAWLQHGPPAARVESVEWNEIAASEFDGFRIRS
jgi:acylphosphatase